MLLVPPSLIARWSAFSAQLTEQHALLTAHLDGGPVADILRLAVTRAHQSHWQREETARLFAPACARLSQWCVEHKRYIHNVSNQQCIDLKHDNFLLTADDIQRWRYPQKGWRLLVGESAQRALKRQHARLSSHYADPPCWSQAANTAPPGEAILIAAPLCLEKNGEEITAFLCDYASFIRRPGDAVLPLGISEQGKQALWATLGEAAGSWHPFCRVLGIVRQSPTGLWLEVLQLELRTPVPDRRDSPGDPAWDEMLIRDALETGTINELYWARKQLSEYPPVDSDSEALVERHLALAQSDTDMRRMTRRSGTPLQGPDAFWCALAALLPAWRQDFPLSADQLAALLAAFERAYPEKWWDTANHASLEGALRYTPASMTEAHRRLASLHGKKTQEAPMEQIARLAAEARAALNDALIRPILPTHITLSRVQQHTQDQR